MVEAYVSWRHLLATLFKRLFKDVIRESVAASTQHTQSLQKRRSIPVA